MVVFPNAKINLGLRILEKRADGYHNICSFFYPINYRDALEITPSEKFSFTQTGLRVKGSIEDNLCIRAYRLITETIPLPPVNIHLHKAIPMGAGLGGGSSDAAFTLIALNKLFHLNISSSQLQKHASKLGADCPFFINNSPSIGRNIGDVLKPIQFSLSGYFIALITPNIDIPTREAYNRVRVSGYDDVEKTIYSGIKNWKDSLINDFEYHIFNNFPILKKIKSTLYDNGAIYASMSGSGSSIYGIFPEKYKFNVEGFPVKWIEPQS